MADNQRIEDLRRRVQKDPTSIAFAQLAEECRRAGNLQESVDVCRAGLALHPGYLSARVTLGRALIELDDLSTALVELEYVLRSAPENLAAIRGLAEIHHRQGRLKSALAQYRAALLLARNDPDLQRTVDELSYQLEPPAAPEAAEGLSLDQVQDEFLQSLSSRETATAPELGRDAGPESTLEATPVAGLELEPKPEAKPELELELEPESEPEREPEPEPEPEQSSLTAIVPALPSEPTAAFVTPPVAVERVDVAEAPEGAAEREREAASETAAEHEDASPATPTVLPVSWEAAPALIPPPVLVERAEVEELSEDTADRESELDPDPDPEPEQPEQPEQALLTAAVVPDAVPWEAAPALIPQPVLVERAEVEDLPEDIADREPEPEPEQASLTAAVVPDAVPWEMAPALIPQPVLVERVDVEEPPEDTAERDRGLRMIGALEQWIDAIHVVRAQPLA